MKESWPSRSRVQRVGVTLNGEKKINWAAPGLLVWREYCVCIGSKIRNVLWGTRKNPRENRNTHLTGYERCSELYITFAGNFFSLGSDIKKWETPTATKIGSEGLSNEKGEEPWSAHMRKIYGFR